MISLTFTVETRVRVEKNQIIFEINIIVTIYAPVNITAVCIIFSGGQIHYECFNFAVEQAQLLTNKTAGG